MRTSEVNEGVGILRGEGEGGLAAKQRERKRVVSRGVDAPFQREVSQLVEKIKARDRAERRSTASTSRANFDFLFVARFYENSDPSSLSLSLYIPLDITHPFDLTLVARSRRKKKRKRKKKTGHSTRRN